MSSTIAGTKGDKEYVSHFVVAVRHNCVMMQAYYLIQVSVTQVCIIFRLHLSRDLYDTRVVQGRAMCTIREVDNRWCANLNFTIHGKKVCVPDGLNGPLQTVG